MSISRPTSPDPEPFAPSRHARVDERLARLDRFADLLDSRFRIPGTGLRFGLDSIIGLIPGIGDTATAATSLYVVVQAREMGCGKWTLARMLGNVAIDGILGSVPLLGDIFDFAWKANRRNIRLLREDLARCATRPWP